MSITSECQRLINLRHDTDMIGRNCPSSTSDVMTVMQHRENLEKKPSSVESNKPPSACQKCGNWHYARFCLFKKHLCQKCNKSDHKEGCCRSTRPRKKSTMQKHPEKQVAHSYLAWMWRKPHLIAMLQHSRGMSDYSLTKCRHDCNLIRPLISPSYQKKFGNR